MLVKIFTIPLFKRLVLLWLAVCCYSAVYSQTPIKGIVVDSGNSQPLPGVIVLIKGSSQGATQTDIDGRYSINAPSNSVLIFKYLGFKETEINVESRTMIDVKLESSSTTLDQVVVVGYGTTTKRDLTGAIARIDNTKLETLPNTNVTQALRGGTAGVTITATGRAGSGSAVQIRGGSRSIAANNNALIVVDGIIFRGALNDLNPNDISSFEILKDASSAAIFGSQAANGVVLITTKKGKGEKPVVQFNSYAGTQSFVKNQELENAGQYRQKMFNSAKTIYYRTTTGQIPGVARQPVFEDVSTYFLNPVEISQFNKGISRDAIDEISQPAPLSSYNMSVSAATDKTKYFISGEYTSQKGVVIGDQFKRASGRVNLETTITDWLKIGTNSFFAYTNNSGNPADMEIASLLSPYSKYYLDNYPTALKPNPMDDGYLSNPLFPTLNRSKIDRYNLFAIAYADVKIPFIEGLTYRFNYSNNIRWDRDFNFVPSYKILGAGLFREASASQTLGTTTDMYLENLVKYNRSFGKHNFDVTLLYNYNAATSNSTKASANTFPNDALTYYSLELGRAQTASASYNDYHSISSMARLAYKFNNRYLITGTFRRDGASVFGANNKYATFPSVAVSWIASEDAFFKKLSFINFLKLRASYGANGNQIGRYSTLSPISPSSAYNYIFGDATAGAIGIGTTTLGNDNLRWELTYSTNIGLDFEILQGRVTGALEYYNSNSSDLLLPRTIPALNGFPSQLQNIGKVNNNGIEITLNSTNIKSGNVLWTTGFNFSANKNKIVALQGIDNNHDGIEDDDIASTRFIGKPLSAIYGYEIYGVWQKDEVAAAKVFNARPGDVKIRDVNGDGKITPADDRKILGYDRPDFLYGFNTTISYKGLSLYTLLTGSVGGERSNNSILDPSSKFTYKVRGTNIDWWTPDNPSTTHPSIDYGNALGVTFIENTSFLRVQDISLSYNFNKKLLDKWKLGSLRVYVSAKNPVMFTKWSGWDPEVSSGYGQFPLMRSVIAGLSVSL
ncbi:SusC/RagA family TonB-linked outer membrane protein [Mucilaginibacter sp. UYCu711]|uniref:SusC/RagA family TonB-linked outer membrane protein n=1 Tax=Mucilaginibacter sp. UYCu711 TaxID=3156339 RepID=UPI003D24855E